MIDALRLLPAILMILSGLVMFVGCLFQMSRDGANRRDPAARNTRLGLMLQGFAGVLMGIGSLLANLAGFAIVSIAALLMVVGLRRFRSAVNQLGQRATVQGEGKQP
jgi:uncharacterized membrane protein YfcA